MLIENPLTNMQRVPLEKVQANNYNPNAVAKSEMRLLYVSIKEDWYTQPCVTYFDEEIDKYVIVDWFHRYLTMRTYKDIYDRNRWLLPIVVIEKDIWDRMASTIRHNRARWKHSVDWMANLVFKLLKEWRSDQKIMEYVWLESEELKRLKITTWFAKLFNNVQYWMAWQTKKQLDYKREYAEQHPNDLADII